MVEKQMEAQHTLYDSLEEMLAPETLSELLSRSVSKMEIHPMIDHGGAAGGKLDYVDTDFGRLVLKRMSMEYDWIMYATSDQRCRSVRLWQYRLLDELRPHIEHKILACARDQDGWGILMHDLSEGLFTGDRPISPSHVTVFLDRLARLHARFWNDPRLLDPRIGLGDVTIKLKLSSLKLAQKQNGDQRGQIPKWVRGGWAVLETVLEPDLFLQLQHLYKHPQVLFEAMEGYPYTLVHNDYREDNLAYLEPDQAVIFDWHSAAHGLMTVDLARFTGKDCVMNSIGKTGAIRHYQDRLETYLGTSIEDDTWQAMLDIGHLVDALTICFPAYLSKHAEKPGWRNYFERRVMQQIQQMRDGLRWL